ncbi:MAG: GNAT family N-acetyltransferase [Candidatus Latescibacterota bacterium]|nr:GNAT family N-acetyltransferase [Candidatus Latescibacterota bacterium]
MTSSPQLRSVRPSEIDDLIELFCSVYSPHAHDRYRGYIEGDPTWRPEHNPVAVVDGRIVGALRIWDRQLHVGETPVRIAGIGGVCTDPDFRGRGIASALTNRAQHFMSREGFDLGLLFSWVPARFYRRLGWASIAVEAFAVTMQAHPPEKRNHDWVASPFSEQRDLDEVVDLYRRHNAGRSGTTLRPRPYWDWSPSRVRGVLPTTVFRHRDSDALGGYLNWELDEEETDRVWIHEIAWDEERSGTLVAITDFTIATAGETGRGVVAGEVPPTHAFVESLTRRGEGDAKLQGDSSMMAWPVNVERLLAIVCPQAPTTTAALPWDLLARLMFGESSWSEIAAVRRARGIDNTLDDKLFPRRELIAWTPDHF